MEKLFFRISEKTNIFPEKGTEIYYFFLATEESIKINIFYRYIKFEKIIC